jgi:hypothetical protein
MARLGTAALLLLAVVEAGRTASPGPVELPQARASRFRQLGCALPEGTLTNRTPGVIRGQFRQSGAFDWAVICLRGTEQTITLLVGETGSEQFAKTFLGDGVRLGSRMIGTVSGGFIRQHCNGSLDAVPPIDHDGILDTMKNYEGDVTASAVRYLYRGKWLDLGVSL